MKQRNRAVSVMMLAFCMGVNVWGQNSTQTGTQDNSSTPAPARPQPSPKPETMKRILRPASAVPSDIVRYLALDQKDIWTSPFKVRVQDLNWILPLAGLTAGAINADAELSSRINTTGTFARHSSTISDAGLALAVGGAGSLYFFGRMRHDDHQRETGILGVEAATDSLVVTEVLKLVTRRARPTDSNFQGNFYNSSSITNSSFPSTHAMMAWSAATVLAHQYPGPLTQIFAYGLATGVSVARVTGKDHFPSDVIVGSALGWLIGRQVYKTHHDPDLPGGSFGTFDRGNSRESSSPGRFSPYVPMDSWVYPAFDRLAALGVLDSDFKGLRPWTRKECARLLEEASGAGDFESAASRLYSALEKEFAIELNGQDTKYLSVDSVYARVTGIAGQPLTDGYHFGRTIVSDYGRPYQEGTNSLGGFSASGSSGALGFNIRGEMEHAPSSAGLSQALQNAIAIADSKSIAVPASPIPAFNQFRLLDTYISLNLKNWQTSFGKQTLWTGPTQDPFLWSDNAEPIYMFRIDQTTPVTLPSILKFLGPVRTEFWVGKLTGQHFVDTQDPAIGIVSSIGRSLERQPMVNGVKLNFKPTANFEFGVGKTGLWGGPDFPITLGSTRRSLFSTTNSVGRGNDPGDRRSTFDFSYRIPGLRRYLTLYEDSFVEDEISPIGYPRRAAHNPGIDMPRLPWLPHLDLRVEAAYTNLPGLREPAGGGFFYWNVRYLDGYTNQGNIIGNGTVGRQGISFRGQSTYWFASDKNIQIGYRTMTSDPMFLQGGSLRDAHLRSEWKLRPNLSLSTFAQYEWWNFPLLTARHRQNDLTASVQLTYWPHWRLSGK